MPKIQRSTLETIDLFISIQFDIFLYSFTHKQKLNVFFFHFSWANGLELNKTIDFTEFSDLIHCVE